MNEEKKGIGRLTKILIIILLAATASGLYIYQNSINIGLSKPALILTVSTNLTTNTGNPMVNNVTFEQSSIPFFYKRTDVSPNFPEIQANARVNKFTSSPASYWAATHYNWDEGVYTLKIFFRDGQEPKQGDILIIPIRIISYTGAIAYKSTAFYLWK